MKKIKSLRIALILVTVFLLAGMQFVQCVGVDKTRCTTEMDKKIAVPETSNVRENRIPKKIEKTPVMEANFAIANSKKDSVQNFGSTFSENSKDEVKKEPMKGNINEMEDHRSRQEISIGRIKHILSEKCKEWMENISIANHFEKILLPHRPIIINDDDDFMGPFGILPNLMKGVIRGKGTKENPYVISRWRINAFSANGIYIGNTTSYCIIKNCYIYNGENRNDAIHLHNAKNIEIQNVTLINNKCGIYLKYCTHNMAIENKVEWNGYGILIEKSSNNNITSNHASSNYYGIYLQDSSNNLLHGNILEGNMRNFMITGSNYGYYDNDIDASNTANGKPVLYFIGKRNLVFNDIDAGFLGFVSCNNVTIKNTSISYSGSGVFLYDCKDFIIENNTFLYDEFAIYFHCTSNSIVKNNYIENYGVGIYLIYSSNNTIRNSNLYNGAAIGCVILDSQNNAISNVKIFHTVICIYLEESEGNVISQSDMEALDTTESWFTDVINIKNSPNNIIRGNTLKKGWDGILVGEYSYHQTIENNIITSYDGIYIVSSSPNNIIKNNNLERNRYNGILLKSDNNWVYGNVFIHTRGTSFWMEDCSNNTLRYNEFRNNRWNLKIRGWKLSDYIHDIDTSNTADDNPIYYFINKEDLIFEDKAVGMLGMINCKNISIENVSAMNSGQGILVTYSTNISIDNCLFNNNEYGIYLYRSSRCIITKNDISSNISTTQAGIYIESSSQNIVANNSFINFKMDDGTRLEYGIWVSHSSANIIENNVQGQITLWDGTDNTSIRRNRNCTIDIDDSSNVSIIDNQIIGTSGVGIIIGKYSDVLVEGNYISNCGISGMCISESRGNNIFKNNVIANNSDYGIEIDFMGATSENVFINNGIAGNGQDLLTGGGVWCIETQLSPIKFHNNSFVGNKWAFFISRDCQGIVDATNNWWGDESGPFDPSPLPPDFNPFGKGDWTTDFVNYRPWLTEP